MFNSENKFGSVAIVLHWSMALIIFGLFGVGLYMVELTYYDRLYRALPFYHMSFGILLGGLIIVRVIWTLANPSPRPLDGGRPYAAALAKLAHLALYLLMTTCVCTGYLITTADGSPINVFDWFEVPALVTGLPAQEDTAGTIHEWLAYSLAALTAVHAAAALKHHFIYRDDTLRRMLGLSAQ